MVSLIDGVGARHLLKRRAAQRVPVSTGPKKPVKNEEGRTVRPVFLVMQIHVDVCAMKGH